MNSLTDLQQKESVGMMRTLPPRAVVSCWVVLLPICLGGCVLSGSDEAQVAKELYRKVTLNGPLPDRAALPKPTVAFGPTVVFRHSASIHVPPYLLTRHQSGNVKAFLNPDGLVVAKYFELKHFDILGVLFPEAGVFTEHMQIAFEAEVPPAWFTAPPPDWRAPKVGVEAMRRTRLIAAGAGGSPKSSLGQRPWSIRNIYRECAGGTRLIEAAAERARTVEGRITSGRKQVDVRNLLNHLNEVAATDRHVGWYVMGLCGLCAESYWSASEGIDTGLSGPMKLLVQHPGAMTGLTQEGSDRRFQVRDSFSCRVQNLGGRRIHIEIRDVVYGATYEGFSDAKEAHYER